MNTVYVKWYEEDTDDAAIPRRVMAAWLVRDVPIDADESDLQPEPLAYLGPLPRVTPALREELAVIFPDIPFDWDALRAALSAAPDQNNVTAAPATALSPTGAADL